MLLSLSENNEPIGIITVVKRDYLPYPDIGFALLPDFEGKGLAFEGSQIAINQLVNEFKFPELYAFTEFENHKSIKLIERLGFENQGTIIPNGEDEELRLYKISI